MRVEVASSSSWPGFQFVVYAETDSDKVIIGQVGKISTEGEGRPWIHGIHYGPDGRDRFSLGPVSFNFGWLEEKHFNKENVRKTRKSHKISKR